MYGTWILTIIFSSLALLGFVFGLVFMARERIMSNGFNDTCAVCGFSLFAVFINAVIICCFAGGYSIYSSKEQLLKFEETRNLVEIYYEDGIDLDSEELTREIVEQNQWLITAKIEKKAFGVFSQYYYIDLESIDPIKLPERVKREDDFIKENKYESKF